jgi:hypothetical protein
MMNPMTLVRCRIHEAEHYRQLMQRMMMRRPTLI